MAPLLPLVIWCVTASIISMNLDAAESRSYPSKPVRIVTSEVGGSADVAARMLAQGISPPLGQSMVVDNRPGGPIPGDIVSKARPDGYTLLFFGGTFWLQPLLRKHVSYDPLKDFSPITLVLIQPNVLVVHPSVPVHTVKELIALAKARPGALNYAVGSVGASHHLGTELFKTMAGLDIVGIGYRGTGPAIIGLITGQVQIMFPPASAVVPHVQSGKVRILAVASSQPTPVVPNVPTVAASGLPGFESVSTLALFAPAQTPANIVDRLNRESVRFLNTPEVRERFVNLGAEVVGSSPAELTAKVRSEISRVARLIKDAGIRVE